MAINAIETSTIQITALPCVIVNEYVCAMLSHAYQLSDFFIRFSEVAPFVLGTQKIIRLPSAIELVESAENGVVRTHRNNWFRNRNTDSTNFIVNNLGAVHPSFMFSFTDEISGIIPRRKNNASLASSRVIKERTEPGMKSRIMNVLPMSSIDTTLPSVERVSKVERCQVADDLLPCHTP